MNIILLLAAGDPVEDGELPSGTRQTSTTANIYSQAIMTADEEVAEVLVDIANYDSHRH